MAHKKLQTALAGRGKTYLVFMSLEPGNHLNTATKDPDSIKRIIESHCRTNKLELETTAAIDKFARWQQTASKRERYSDVWIGFSNESWLTVTYNPRVQPLFCIEMAPHQTTRNFNLMRDGVPNWVRCYDALYSERVDNRPKGSKYRYTICFVGMYRSVQKRQGKPQSGYWTMQVAEDPADYLNVWENESTFDHVYGPFALQVGLPSKKLGMRIEFKRLPPAVKIEVLRKYQEIWKLKEGREAQASPSKRPGFLGGRKKKNG